MAHTLTETSTFDATITVPDNGDAADAASVEGLSVGGGVGFQALANRTKYLFDGLSILTDGLLLGISSMWSDATTVVVIQQGVIMLSGQAYFHASAGYGSGSIEGGGAFAVSSWYYVYGFAGASNTVAIQFSLTVPDDGLVWKSTAVGTHRYLGAFRTDSSGGIMPFVKHRGNYSYRFGSLGSNLTAHSGTTSATPGNQVILRPSPTTPAFLPPHSRNAKLEVNVAAGSAGGLNLATTTAEITTTQGYGFSVLASTPLNPTFLDIVTMTDQSIGIFSDLANTVVAVVGWSE